LIFNKKVLAVILMKPIYCCKVGVAGAGNITAATSAYELTNAICSDQLIEDKLVIVLNYDAAKNWHQRISHGHSSSKRP